MHDLYIAEIYVRGYLFVADIMDLSSFNSTLHSRSSEKKATQRKVKCYSLQSRSRSFKLITIDSPYAIFLLVFYCNYVLISYRFRVITI